MIHPQYAPVLFHQAGLPEQTAGFLASGISAILFLLISIPAVIYADSWSRRTSIMTGGFLLTGCMGKLALILCQIAVPLRRFLTNISPSPYRCIVCFWNSPRIRCRKVGCRRCHLHLRDDLCSDVGYHGKDSRK